MRTVERCSLQLAVYCAIALPGDGGATGPDLTQVAGRFDLKAVTEAIMDPSKVISDQYKASTVVTVAGKTITGRIVSENDDQISILTDPEDSSKVVDIPRKQYRRKPLLRPFPSCQQTCSSHSTRMKCLIYWHICCLEETRNIPCSASRGRLRHKLLSAIHLTDQVAVTHTGAVELASLSFVQRW